MNFAVLVDHRLKLKESKKRDKYLNLARELKKLWNIKVMVILIVKGTLGTVTKRIGIESDGDTDCKWNAWYSHQRIGTGTGGLGNKRTSGDHPNYTIVEISQNTKKT